jgi:hypothetical protein
MCISPHILLLNHDNYLGVFFLTGEIMVKTTKNLPWDGDSRDEPEVWNAKAGSANGVKRRRLQQADKNVGPRLEFLSFLSVPYRMEHFRPSKGEFV